MPWALSWAGVRSSRAASAGGEHQPEARGAGEYLSVCLLGPVQRHDFGRRANPAQGAERRGVLGVRRGAAGAAAARPRSAVMASEWAAARIGLVAAEGPRRVPERGSAVLWMQWWAPSRLAGAALSAPRAMATVSRPVTAAYRAGQEVPHRSLPVRRGCGPERRSVRSPFRRSPRRRANPGAFRFSYMTGSLCRQGPPGDRPPVRGRGPAVAPRARRHRTDRRRRPPARLDRYSSGSRSLRVELIRGSDLRSAAIDEQFDSRDEAGVV